MTVPVLESLRHLLPELSSRESRAARYLLANDPTAGLTTVAELAEQSNVSTATVLRLIKRLGFSVYAEFQQALRLHIKETLESPLTRLGERSADQRVAGASFLARSCDVLAEHFRVLPELIPDVEFDKVVSLLCDSRRDIHLIGGRYSSHLANYMADMLMAVRGGIHPVYGQTHRWPQCLLDMNRHSVLIVFDVRRYQDDVAAFAAAAARRGATIVLLSDIWQSPVARHADQVLTFPVESASIFDSLTIGFGVVEALVGAIAERAGGDGSARIRKLEGSRIELSPTPAAATGPRSIRNTVADSASDPPSGDGL